MVVPGRNTPNGTDMRFYLQACRGGGGVVALLLVISSYGNSNKTGSTRVNGGLFPSDWCQ